MPPQRWSRLNQSGTLCQDLYHGSSIVIDPDKFLL
jgi:hypothetical protein